jgi:membrane protein DedA with SNARE-associated domain
MPVGGVGAVGGSTGDQLWVSLLRGRIHWLDRFPWLGKYRDVVSARVHAHETAIVLASRFLPGLRTAIPIACAYAGMRALTFTLMIQRGRGGVAIVAGFEPADLPRLIRFATI